MNLLKPFYRLAGERKAGGAPCPSESQILGYIQGVAAAPINKYMERHLADCDRCRELAAACFNSTDEDLAEAKSQQINDNELNNQMARILGYIEADDRRQASRPRSLEPSLQPSLKPARGLFLSYTQLAATAVIFCAIVAGAIFYFTRGESPAQIASAAITEAMHEERERRIEARVSGEIPYATYKEVRGDEGDGYEAHLDRAKERLQSEKGAADSDVQMALARLYLVSGKRPDARQAQEVLKRLEASGIESAELFNDLGVASYRLGSPREAIIYFNRALEIAPGFDQALFNRALAREDAGELEEAHKDWERFINATTDENWKREALTRLNR